MELGDLGCMKMKWIRPIQDEYYGFSSSILKFETYSYFLGIEKNLQPLYRDEHGINSAFV